MNRLSFYALPLLLALWLFFSVMFVVDQRQFGVVYALGEIKRVVEAPGLYWKWPPPFQSVSYLDRRTLTLDSPETDRFITAEKKNLVIDWYLKWSITDPKLYIRSFGQGEHQAAMRLHQLVKSALSEEVTRHTVQQALAGQRSQIMATVQERVSEDAKSAGIRIIDMRIKRVDYDASITESVYKRMTAERKRVANELRSTGEAEKERIKAQAEREREVVIAQAFREAQRIKGEGDARATATYAQAFGRDAQFARFYRSLEAYRASFNDRRDFVLMDPGSEFLRVMRTGQ